MQGPKIIENYGRSKNIAYPKIDMHAKYAYRTLWAHPMFERKILKFHINNANIA
jgi:hypothetical protein